MKEENTNKENEEIKKMLSENYNIAKEKIYILK